ncbi:LLM class flavin-dependent oxidoreductase [Roseateles sp.]|uniref:LLM class flavin-dependent oxidoreductase n=1 Tax=Roseateles sp. TaxID=1971397 RepID=UPI0039E9238A
MSQRQLRLGAILSGVGTTQHAWRAPDLPGDASIDIRWAIAQAKKAEAAKFDLIFIVDSPYITPDTAPHFLNRLEPLTLLSALAVHTERIGLVATATTSYNEPFNLARAFASLDLISGGRAGWNVVTTGLEGAAGNYGLEKHIDHALRYRRAQEHLDVVRGLWDSYEDDAFPRDKASGVFLDKAKLHALNHHGEFFNVAGPLNISRSAQGQPVIFQAGDSSDGRDLAARNAEGIYTNAETLEDAQAFYRDIKQRTLAAGRRPEHISILPGLVPIIAATDDEARRREAEIHGAVDLKKALVALGRPFNYLDFSAYPLDDAFPDLAGLSLNGYRGHAERIIRIARDEKLTLRQTALRFAALPSPFVGTARTVADEIERWFKEEGADGFNFRVSVPSEFDAFIDGVLPLLRQRGLVRTDYEGSTLREHLGLPFPTNRYAAARAAA